MRKPSDGKSFSLLTEALSLKNLNRTGWIWAKAKRESVAEHSFGVAFIALLLAKMEKLSAKDEASLVRRALLHDLHEARLGDLVPSEKKKRKPDEAGTEKAMLSDTHLEGELPFPKTGRIATLAKDADRLDMLLRALENKKNGNRKMAPFVKSALSQIRSKSGKKLAQLALR